MGITVDGRPVCAARGDTVATALLAAGIDVFRLTPRHGLARSTTIHRHVTQLEAVGDGRVNAVRFRSGGRDHEIPTQVLLLHTGVVPQVNLTMAAGADHTWNARRRAFEPLRDASGQSTVPGLFIAGDSGGIGGALTAEAEGAISAFGVLRRLGRLRAEDEAAERTWRRRLRSALRGRSFLDALYRPDVALASPADDVVICRCEEISAGEIREAIRRGARGPNQVKAFTRAGMGACQARMCGLTVNALISAETGLSPDSVGHMRMRMPVKPITVAQLAGFAHKAEER